MEHDADIVRDRYMNQLREEVAAACAAGGEYVELDRIRDADGNEIAVRLNCDDIMLDQKQSNGVLGSPRPEAGNGSD